MITKFLGIFIATRMFDERCTVIPKEQDRKKATWQEFAEIMQNYYSSTENLTLKSY